MISMQLETSIEMIIIIIFHHCFICGSSYLGCSGVTRSYSESLGVTLQVTIELLLWGIYVGKKSYWAGYYSYIWIPTITYSYVISCILAHAARGRLKTYYNI